LTWFIYETNISLFIENSLYSEISNLYKKVTPMEITTKEFKNLFPRICSDDDCINALLSVVEPRKLNAGDQIITQNQRSDTVFLVCSGRLNQEMDTHDGMVNLGDCLPGCWAGELGFIEPDEAAANITAAEETVVLPVSQEELKTLVETSPGTVSALLHAFSMDIAERLRETRRQVLKQISEDEFTLEEKRDERDQSWMGKVARSLMGYYGGKQ
jgi:CRP-like cAMP-binding protein